MKGSGWWRSFVVALAAIAPGPILAAVQKWYNLFDIVFIAHPNWPSSAGAFSIGVGTVTILPVVALWPKMTERQKTLYLKISIIGWLTSLLVCLLAKLAFKITLFPSHAIYEIAEFIWFIFFLAFGFFLTHVVAGVALYLGKK